MTTPQGHAIEYSPSGKLQKVVTKSGAEAHYSSSGKVSTIRTANGTMIAHGPGGQRQVVTEHRDPGGRVDSRVVSMGPHRGFVEHRFERGGHEYMRRTYLVGGHTYVSVYRGYSYRGVVYYRYIPAYYYSPRYYAWGYSPWGSPVVYTGWGWVGSPWYGWSGYYFSPYSSYPSASFWLTDYLIAQNLQAAYDAQAAANTSATGQTPVTPPQGNSAALSPEVKQMIAEEVKSQLAAEQAAAGQNNTPTTAPTGAPQQPITSTDEVPPALDPNLRVFIVTASLDVKSSASGQPCTLSPGDVLMRTENTPDKDNTVAVSVVSNQKSDCRVDSSPRVQVADLQEMHNHFREQMDTGLKTLADNQGKNGIPSGPAASPSDNPTLKGLPTAEDISAKGDLQKQQDDANQTEKEVQQASPSSGSAGGND